MILDGSSAPQCAWSMPAVQELQPPKRHAASIAENSTHISEDVCISNRCLDCFWGWWCTSVSEHEPLTTSGVSICTHMHIHAYIICNNNNNNLTVFVVTECIFFNFPWSSKAPGNSLGLSKANIFSEEWAQGGPRWWYRETTDLSTHGSFPFIFPGSRDSEHLSAPAPGSLTCNH